ncbi:MAG: hypothetical protein K2H44_07260 [Muribaculaceae bacterium]|nr:hypothetical protein [Muribaculaceae bacterium]
MRPIENLTENFLTAYYADKKNEYQVYIQKIIDEIGQDEWQFRLVEDNYKVAKALFYVIIQDDDNRISLDIKCSIFKLMYYCLLKNYISSIQENNPTSLNYGSKLLLIILSDQTDFFTYGILVGNLNIMPNYAQKYIEDQLKLFGGISLEAGPSIFDDNLNDYLINNIYSDLLQNSAQNLPTGLSLESYKTNCTPVINKIVKNLGSGLKYPENDDLW